MHLIAEGWDLATVGDFMNKVGYPGAILFFLAVAAIWYARTFGPDHKAEILARTATWLMMKEHVPRQTQMGEDTVRVLENLGKKESDVVRNVVATHDKIDDLAVAIVNHGCPDSEEIRKARLAPYTQRVEERKESMRKKPPAVAEGE